MKRIENKGEYCSLLQTCVFCVFIHVFFIPNESVWASSAPPPLHAGRLACIENSSQDCIEVVNKCYWKIHHRRQLAHGRKLLSKPKLHTIDYPKGWVKPLQRNWIKQYLQCWLLDVPVDAFWNAGQLLRRFLFKCRHISAWRHSGKLFNTWVGMFNINILIIIVVFRVLRDFHQFWLHLEF